MTLTKLRNGANFDIDPNDIKSPNGSENNKVSPVEWFSNHSTAVWSDLIIFTAAGAFDIIWFDV
jgi:hypothetical protein